MPSLLLAVTLLAAAPLEVPQIHQFKNGCGAASVAMLVAYWQPKVAPDHQAIYAKLIDAEHKGIRLTDMKAYLDSIGFRAFTLRGKPEQLQEHLAKGRPVIVPIRASARSQSHFIVLTSIDDSRISFNDPTKSKTQHWTRAKFDKQWTNAENWLLLATPSQPTRD